MARSLRSRFSLGSNDARRDAEQHTGVGGCGDEGVPERLCGPIRLVKF